MKSYASVDRTEGSYVICEVELMELENSQVEDCDKAVEMIDIPLEMALKSVENVDDGDILIVEHNNGDVIEVYCKDEEEKQRRIDYLRQIM